DGARDGTCDLNGEAATRRSKELAYILWQTGLNKNCTILLSYGESNRIFNCGTDKGYQTFDALRLWSLWPPRFASARKSRWGSMVPREVVGQSKSRMLFADDRPARTHPRLGPERTLVDCPKVPVGGHQRPAIRKTAIMEYRARPTPNY